MRAISRSSIPCASAGRARFMLGRPVGLVWDWTQQSLGVVGTQRGAWNDGLMDCHKQKMHTALVRVTTELDWGDKKSGAYPR